MTTLSKSAEQEQREVLEVLTPDQVIERLKDAVLDLHWMARRYADGRCTFAPTNLNMRTRELIRLGVLFKHPLFARDGMGRGWDGLTEEEAAAAEADMPRMHAQHVAEQDGRMAELTSAQSSRIAALEAEIEQARKLMGEAAEQLESGGAYTVSYCISCLGCEGQKHKPDCLVTRLRDATPPTTKGREGDNDG